MRAVKCGHGPVRCAALECSSSVVNTDERSWRSEASLASDMEMQSVEFALLVFSLALV